MTDKIKTTCVGCKACENVCPVQAIVMKRNQEGFEYPEILEARCIKCKKCEMVCPALRKEDKESLEKIYAARCSDKKILFESSSGGVFSILAQNTLRLNGVVYGTIFSKDYRKVMYARAVNLEDIEPMRGSKYVESLITQEIIKQLMEDISSGRKVLFTGTGCQINGLQNLCKVKRINTQNVIWVDFYVCSGKVSSLLWEAECDKIGEKGKLQQVNFRSKKRGWQNFSIDMKIDNKHYYKDFLVHPWSKFLGSSYSRRKSCLQCKYSQKNSKADISMGDFWNSEVLPKKWNDNKGVSVVSANTKKGLEFFEELTGIEYQKVELKREKPSKEKENKSERESFWKIYHEEGYINLCQKYAKIGFKEMLLFGIIRPILIKTNLLSVIKRGNNVKQEK